MGDSSTPAEVPDCVTKHGKFTGSPDSNCSMLSSQGNAKEEGGYVSGNCQTTLLVLREGKLDWVMEQLHRGFHSVGSVLR